MGFYSVGVQVNVAEAEQTDNRDSILTEFSSWVYSKRLIRKLSTIRGFVYSSGYCVIVTIISGSRYVKVTVNLKLVASMKFHGNGKQIIYCDLHLFLTSSITKISFIVEQTHDVPPVP